jgi:glutamate-1-semialdehyde aminotransferase
MSIPLVSRRSSADFRSRAARVIPGGASTGSKQTAALYGPDTTFGPAHFASASGCRLLTPDAEEIVDCTMALGAVALGYADDAVTEAVTDAVRAGNVAGLSHVLEVQLAERLIEVIPCAEQVRFLKSGAEGVAAAVRIARAHTGRSTVVGCGYFGWLDWWTQAAGVPAGAHADFRAVPFDDIAALEAAAHAAGNTLAAIILEPVIERLPSEAWVLSAQQLCAELGAVLIFDEMKTGFRLRTAGYQELAKITPDLAVFGKALANGFPLSAVVGKGAVMRAAEDTWISSTLASEATALAAALAVLEWHARGEVCEALAEAGAEMRGAVERAITASAIPGVHVRGLDPMWLIDFDRDEQRTRFSELALQRGVLFKRGAYNFASTAHDQDAVAAIETAASESLVQIRDEARGE